MSKKNKEKFQLFRKETGRRKTIKLIRSYAFTLFVFVLVALIFTLSARPEALLYDIVLFVILIGFVAYSFLSLRIRKLEEEREEQR